MSDRVLTSATLPVIEVIIGGPTRLLPVLVTATSIEQMKKPRLMHDVVHEMKTERTLHILKTLNMLATQARVLGKRAQQVPATEAARKGPQAPVLRPLDPATERELRAAFSCFEASAVLLLVESGQDSV